MRNRKLHLDMLKILSICMVIFNHSYGYRLFSVLRESNLSVLYTFLSSLSKTAVPIFFMVSGALLLSRDESITYTYKKRVLPFILTIITFSMIIYLFRVIFGNGSYEDLKYVVVNIISHPVIEPYWFMYTYLGFLISLPYLRRLVSNLSKKEMEYLIVISLFFSVIIQLLNIFLSTQVTTLIDFSLFLSTPFIYPMIGFYLEKYKENITNDINFLPKTSIIFVTWSLISILIIKYDLSLQTEIIISESGMNFAILIPCIVIYLYVFEISQKITRDRTKQILVKLSGAVFTIFLTETLIKEKTFDLYNSIIRINSPLINSFIFVAYIFVSGYIIHIVLKRIPIINKLI